MKIDKLINDLKRMKKLGAKEVWFSCDEEGNNIMKEAVIDGCFPEIYDEGKNTIVIFPLNN